MTDQTAQVMALVTRCPSGCNCHSFPDAADMNECGCDGICCTDDWEPWLERVTPIIKRLVEDGDRLAAALQSGNGIGHLIMVGGYHSRDCFRCIADEALALRFALAEHAAGATPATLERNGEAELGPAV